MNPLGCKYTYFIRGPLQAVGKALGNRDHTTVIHGAEKIAKEVVQNESVRNTIDIIIKKINPS